MLTDSPDLLIKMRVANPAQRAAWRRPLLSWTLGAALFTAAWLRVSLFGLGYFALLLAMTPVELLPRAGPAKPAGGCACRAAVPALVLALGGAAVLLLDGFVGGFEDALGAHPDWAAPPSSQGSFRL